MYRIKKRIIFWSVCSAGILLAACFQQKQYQSPPGYNLNEPEKIILPESLHEISGITFHHGNADTIFAEQDEEGKLFYLNPTDKKPASCKFGKRGDYEDIAICNDQVVVLRSDGVLFTFPFSETGNEEADHVTEWKGVLPGGEYEGMYADEATHLLYVLCKHCDDEKTSKTGRGYILQLAPDGTVSPGGSFTFNIQDIESLTGIKKINFHPSAIALNPHTREWYILSSVNKLLVVADSSWKVKAVYPLNPALYLQPEGMAFDNKNNLYISNEGGELKYGNILKISYSGK